MKIGAVIAAAGVPSGSVGPAATVGSISVAQRIITTLKQAGVSRIAVVTGHDAKRLERRLSQSGVVFLRNDRHQTTEMFESVRMGLSYMQDKFDRILFTPATVPMFTVRTVERLISSAAELAFPLCCGRAGHPILLSRAVAGMVLSDPEGGRLDEVLFRCGAEREYVEVDDDGILFQSGGRRILEGLLERHNDQLTRPVVDVSLARQDTFFDGKVSMLLSLVDETNSVRRACEQMQISYSTGWHILNGIESELGYPVITRSRGGSTRVFSSLTPEGRQLLETYDRFAAAAQQAVGMLYDEFFGREMEGRYG